jgi:ABC-type transport system involved in multi-copper enzyme maturation permease subunit
MSNIAPSISRSAAGSPPALARSSVLPKVLRSEWAKIRSVRSTYWSLLITVVAIVGLAAAFCAAEPGPYNAGFDPVATSLAGVILAQLAIGTLGALVITSEYSTGMIRSTFIAAPQRRAVIAAKAAVFGALAFVIGTVASLAAFLVGQSILGSHGVSLGSPGALRAVIGVGLYLGLLAVFAVGLGTIIRSTPGAIVAVLATLLVLPSIAPVLPHSIRNSVEKFLPSNAGQAIGATIKSTSSLSPWVGIAVFAVYAAVALAIGLLLVGRRDA